MSDRGRRILVAAAGVLCLLPWVLQTAIGYLPESAVPVIAVSVKLSGTFPESVERHITLPLEEAFDGLPGLRTMTSTSRNEHSRVLLRFDENTDTDAAYLSVSQAVDRAASRFPANAQRPAIHRSDPSARPVFVVTMPTRPEEELRRLFARAEGAGMVTIGGGRRTEVLIEVDPERMAAVGVSHEDIVARLRNAQASGTISRTLRNPVTLRERLFAIDEFDRLLVGPGIALQEVAAVTPVSPPTESISRVDGRRCSVVSVSPAGNANAVALCRRLRRVVDELEAFEILYDHGADIEAALSEAIRAMAFGAAGVVAMTVLLVGRFRSALVVAGCVPFCAYLAVATLAALAIDLDVFGLAGVAIGTGLAVDACAVYLDLSRRLSTSTCRPLITSAATTVVVFLPLVFAPRSTAVQFASLAIAVSVSVIGSLLYAFALMPAFLGTPPAGSRRPPEETSRLRGREAYLERLVEKSVSVVSRRPATARFLTAVLAGATPLLLLMPASGTAEDSGIGRGKNLMRVVVEYPVDTVVEAVELDARHLETRLASSDLIEMVAVTYEAERAGFSLRVSDYQKAQRLVRNIVGSGDVSGFVYFPDGSQEEESVPVVVLANDPVEAQSTAAVVGRAAQSLPGAKQVVYQFKTRPRVTRFVIDTEKAALHGVSPRSAAEALYWAHATPVAMKWLSPEGEVDVRLRTINRGRERDSMGNPAHGVLVHPSNARGRAAVPLSTILTRERETVANHIERYNRRYAARLFVDTNRLDARRVRTHLQHIVDEMPRAAGTSVIVDPDAPVRRRRRRKLGLAGALSFFSVVAVVAAAFQSPRAVTFCVLQMLLGWALPALYLRVSHISLTPTVLVGLVVTAGVAVNNAIIVTDTVSEMARPTYTTAEVLRRSLRPIVAATATTILGVLPLAFLGPSTPLAITSRILGLGCLGSIPAIVLTFPVSSLARKT